MLDAALLCLAMNIYHEARGEPIEGQIAVAAVTMNRVEDKRWPDDVCSVVWQPGQFSWTKDGKSDKMRDAKAKQIASDIAVAVYFSYNMGYNDPTIQNIIDHLDGSVFYHADHVTPYWVSSFDLVASIDNHRFYK